MAEVITPLRFVRPRCTAATDLHCLYCPTRRQCLLPQPSSVKYDRGRYIQSGKLNALGPLMSETTIHPTVNAEAEFFEILNDFGNPLEIVREAISNAIDAGATQMNIAFTVEERHGNSRSVIRFSDNGSGMSEEVLIRDFWGLGHSTSRGDKAKIGEKGHGTKIFLRSEFVSVRTQAADGCAFESECDRPLATLSQKQLHRPVIRKIEPFRTSPGTEIEVIGYNDNERSKFVQSITKDYILWFTKMGSVERVFDIATLKDFTLQLKCLDQEEPETIAFGHIFPEENPEIAALFDKYGSDAAGEYVKRVIQRRVRLPNHPEVTFDIIISVEGDAIKRRTNPMLRERGRASTGRYRVLDRYGLWLCKDYIPIERVNEWLSSFGSGSNAFTLLHAFVNCQALKLTANRGTFANTDPKILEELKSEVLTIVAKLDADLENNGLYTLRGWQQEERTIGQEKSEFSRRVKSLKKRNVGLFDGHRIFEPRNESELFGLLTTLVALRPDIFEFEPLDYNTTKGIDLIARDKRLVLDEHSVGYVELKQYLTTSFNHAFHYLRWIVCWDFARNVGEGSNFEGISESDVRKLKAERDDEGRKVYWLDAPKAVNKIQVIPLREFLTNLGVNFVETELLH